MVTIMPLNTMRARRDYAVMAAGGVPPCIVGSSSMAWNRYCRQLECTRNSATGTLGL